MFEIQFCLLVCKFVYLPNVYVPNVYVIFKVT